MSLTPENFAAQYMPLTFTACDVNQAGEISDGSSQQVSVRKYLNANFRYKKGSDGKTVTLPYEVAKGMPYTEMKDALLGFVLDRAKKNKGGLHLLAGSIIYCFDTNPNISVSLSIFQHAFDGKCTPTEVRDVLRLFTYWHKADSAPRKRWQDPQAFADQCLGLDCNGLVGSFFKTQYSWLGIGPETAISSYETRPRAKVRKSLAEIESLDVLVFPGYVHIAVHRKHGHEERRFGDLQRLPVHRHGHERLADHPGEDHLRQRQVQGRQQRSESDRLCRGIAARRPVGAPANNFDSSLARAC